MKAIPFNPESVMQAHQYLYYVIAEPIWTDYEYDMFCKAHGLEGGGGSDIASSYSMEVKILALEMHENPTSYPAKMKFVD